MVVKLNRTTFNDIRSYRSLEINTRACKLPRYDPRRRALLGEAEDKASLLFFTGTPMPRSSYSTVALFSQERARAAAEPPEFRLGAPNHEKCQLSDCSGRPAWPFF